MTEPGQTPPPDPNQPPPNWGPPGYPPQPPYPPYPSQQHPYYPPPPPPRKSQAWKWVLGILLGIVVLGAIGNIARPQARSEYSTPTPTTPATSLTSTAPAAPTGPATTMGPGTYEVGTDIVAGTYKTTGPDGFVCYWARLKDTTGDFQSIIANGTSQGPATVTIKPSDGAFQTNGCQPWMKTG